MATYDGTNTYTVSGAGSATVSGTNDYLVLAPSNTFDGATPYTVIAPADGPAVYRRDGTGKRLVRLAMRQGATKVWLSRAP